MMKCRYQVRGSLQTALFSGDNRNQSTRSHRGPPRPVPRRVPWPKQSARINRAALMGTWACPPLRLSDHCFLPHSLSAGLCQGLGQAEAAKRLSGLCCSSQASAWSTRSREPTQRRAMGLGRALCTTHVAQRRGEDGAEKRRL